MSAVGLDLLLTMIIFASVIVGAALSALACFSVWRWRKKVVPKAFWERMVGGYTSMEEALDSATTSEHQVRVGYEEVANRLAVVVVENETMHQKVCDLETSLESATTDANRLVEGLRDREERWAQAEELRGELEFTVSQLQEAKSLLEENLLATKYDLGESRAALEQSTLAARRSADLEARLGEAIDRERVHAARLAQLESRYQRTADQFRLVSQRAESAEQELQGRNRIGALIGAVSALDSPATGGTAPGGTAPGGPSWWETDATAPTSGAFAPPTSGAFAPPLSASADAASVIDLCEPLPPVQGVSDVESDPAALARERVAAGDPSVRAFERGRTMNDRLQRSYGRLPAVENS